MFARFDRDTAVRWITESPGITDRAIAERAYGFLQVELHVSRICEALAKEGLIRRTPLADGTLGNWPADRAAPADP